MGDGQFRLYYYYPRPKYYNNERPEPGKGTIYSIDLQKNFSDSNRSDVDIITPESPNTQNWTAWGYETVNDDGNTIFHSSAGDALKDLRGEEWGRRYHLVVDPVFPDKAYIGGGLTLGYALHPSVPVYLNPEERGISMHWDPSGYNSYVRNSNNTDRQGHGPMSRIEIYARTSHSPTMLNYLRKIESKNNKTHADSQLLYTDGTFLYYGNDGGLNRARLDLEPDQESRYFKAVDGTSITWEQFVNEVKTIDFSTAHNGSTPRGLSDLPWLGFYQANWDNLNFDLISNLYRGGSLGENGEWISGSQDNGVSVGGGPNTSPYLVQNADGGYGFFGNTRQQLVFNAQHSSGQKTFLVEGNFSPSVESTAVRANLWRQVNDSLGSVNGGIIGTILANNNALYDDGTDLSSKTSKANSIETFFQAPDANGLVQIFPDFDNPDPRYGKSRSLRRDLLGRITPIENINIKWVNYTGIAKNAARNTLANAISSNDLEQLEQIQNNFGGEFYIEVDREGSGLEHINFEIKNIANTGEEKDLRLAIKGETVTSPHLKVSFNRGDTTKRVIMPMHARDTNFYFPTSQHPQNKNIIGIADKKRIYIYSDIFDGNMRVRESYEPTIDFHQLQVDNGILSSGDSNDITSFTFAPWDQTGNTLLVGFRNGTALLVRNAIDDNQETTIETISGASSDSDEVNSVAFSHQQKSSYDNSNDAFFVVSHKSKLFPKIVRYINQAPVADPDFSSYPSGTNNHAIVVDQEVVYSASNEGVHKIDLSNNNGWTKIGGKYSDNLPSTNFFNLAYKENSDRLYAFTYGRGVYYYDTKLTFTPDTDIWQLPPILDLEKNQFIHPLDLVEIIFRIEDPRINPSTELTINKNDQIEIISNQGSILQDPTVLSKKGDWFDHSRSQFLKQNSLLDNLDFFVNATIKNGEKTLKSFSMKDLNINETYNQFKGKNIANIKLNITNIYNKAVDLLGSKKQNIQGQVQLDYGFKYNKEKITAGRKVLLLSDVFSDNAKNLKSSLTSQFNKKRGSLQLLSQEPINIDKSKNLTPVARIKTTAGILTPITIGASNKNNDLIRELSAEIYSGKKNNSLSKKPISRILADEGNLLWWQPEKPGNYFIKVLDNQSQPIIVYDVTVDKFDKSQGELTFLTRFKGFEKKALQDIDFITGTAENPFKNLLSQLKLDQFPLKQKHGKNTSEHILQTSEIDRSSLSGKELLDSFAMSNDFLLDFVDLKKAQKDSKMFKDLHDRVDWDDVDYSMLSGVQQDLIDWDLINKKDAQLSSTFKPEFLSIDKSFFN